MGAGERLLPLFDIVQRHFDQILNEISVEEPYIERKLIADPKWRTQISHDTYRYGGILREYEPDLQKVLAHQRAVILGEPGSGKSTVASVAMRQYAAERSRNSVPILVNLGAYRGDLSAILLQQASAEILETPDIIRKYVLDAADEIPRQLLKNAGTEIRSLLERDTTASCLITSRQAFFAQHGDEIGVNAPVFHLLDFDEEDLREYARKRGLDSQAFLGAVDEAEIRTEVGNPFIAKVTTERLLRGDHLSKLRSENIAFMVQELLASRYTTSGLRSRRAIQLLAVGMETYARNQLTIDEAIQILSVGLGEPEPKIRELIEGLLHSILVRTPAGISFQLHSYGEFLAASELQSQPFDRIRRLAFLDDGTPNDTWINAISFLSEMNFEVRRYFVRNYPDWMLVSSPAAFNEDERTAIVEQIIANVDNAGLFLLNHPTIRPRRVARLVTERNIERLARDLDSTRPEVRGNALVLLGMAKRVDVFAYALPLIKETRRNDSLRYCAIAAALTSELPELINELIPILDRNDPYYDQLLECIGTLMTEDDLPRVIPLILTTSTILTSTLNRIRELRTRLGVVNTLRYLIGNPTSIDHIHAESYLDALIKAIPEHSDNELVGLLGELMLTVERHQIYGDGRLQRSLVHAIQKTNRQADVVAFVLSYYVQHGGTPHVNRPIFASWIDERVAERLIQVRAVDLIQAFSPYLPIGPIRELLAPHSQGVVQAQDENRTRYLAEEAQRRAEAAERLAAKQQAVLEDMNLHQVLQILKGLEEEAWPELPPIRRTWLADRVSENLVALDLEHSIIRLEGTSWSQPRELATLLKIIDYYGLRVHRDDQLVLSLRAWVEEAIPKYFNRHGFSEVAQRQFERLIAQPDQHPLIVTNLIWFLQRTSYESPQLITELLRIAQSPSIEPHTQANAVELLGKRNVQDDTLVQLLRSPNLGVKQAAFSLLVERQHRATIERELAALINDDIKLRAAEVPIPEVTPLDWISKIRSLWAWPKLRDLRQKTLQLALPNLCRVVTETMRKLDPHALPELVKNQLEHTPADWKHSQSRLAIEYERQARILSAQQTPFSEVLTKLKMSTSIVALKIWVEGRTDLPVFDKLLRELLETELAERLDLVNGWPNLLTRPRERWIDGCREAVIIMDGDRGRHLRRRGKPLTAEAKRAGERFKGLPIRLYILERYGIENYFSQSVLEAVLKRSLQDYMPIPDGIPIEDHLVEPAGWPDKFLAWLRRVASIQIRMKGASFYKKSLNEQAAQHMTLADVRGTDLERILTEVKMRRNELQLT